MTSEHHTPVTFILKERTSRIY